MAAESKVADQIAELLASRGIRHVFGIIGAGNAHLFDSIAALGQTEIVCVHHEQAAVMAMQTYYRTSGIVTAAILTTGGGSTNATTGVVGAWADSIPGVIISGNEHSRHARADNPLRMWGVQGYDASGMMAGVTKRAVRLTDPRAVRAELESAFALTTSGRPGPCWVEVPMNVQAAVAAPSGIASTSPGPALPRPRAQAAAVAELLRDAERPLLWLGHGIRLAGAIDQIDGLLEATGAPALVSWAAIDMVDSDDPRILGRAGVYGQRAANFALQNCDALVCIGTRMALPQIGYDLAELARAARIAVVDIDETEATKLVPRVELPIVADAGAFMDELLEVLADEPIAPREDWLAYNAAARERFPWTGPEHDERDGYVNSYPLLERWSELLPDDALVVTDMGTALLSGHQAMRLRPGQRLMTSTGLGEMGFGLPGAVGASLARGRGEVLCLNCDGGMMMNLQELQTIAHHDLPIKIVVFNNDGYLMIKHTQKSLFEGRYSGTDERSGVSCPDFSALAAAFGFRAFAIRSAEDAETVIPALHAHPGPAICEVFTHPEQLFAPKLAVAVQEDGSLVSPPLEDLSPLLPREELAEMMTVGLHDKSRLLEV
ncbi:MAG: thiamine pyrophosphate-binding protein [Solirubrobacteraceae bacterium]